MIKEFYIFGVLFVLLLSFGFASAECDPSDELPFGKSKNVFFNNISYEIYSQFLGDAKSVELKINIGENPEEKVFEVVPYDMLDVGAGTRFMFGSLYGNNVIDQGIYFCTSNIERPCWDSDDGINFYEKGQSDGYWHPIYDDWQEYFSDYDYCEKDTDKPSDKKISIDGSFENVLVEYSCREGYLFKDNYNCPNGCEDGACIKSPESEVTYNCADSDGGSSVYVKGVVSNYECDADEACSPVEDECIDGEVLHERICMNNKLETVEHYCLDECRDGACTKEEWETKKAPGGSQVVCETFSGSLIDESQDGYDNCIDRGYTGSCIISRLTTISHYDGLDCSSGFTYRETMTGSLSCDNFPRGTYDYPCQSPLVEDNDGTERKSQFETYSDQIICCTSPSSCEGCELAGKCYSVGYRKNKTFCSEDSEFAIQKDESERCDNNFECESNVCVSGECVSKSLIQKIIEWFKRLFIKY